MTQAVYNGLSQLHPLSIVDRGFLSLLGEEFHMYTREDLIEAIISKKMLRKYSAGTALAATGILAGTAYGVRKHGSREAGISRGRRQVCNQSDRAERQQACAQAGVRLGRQDGRGNPRYGR